MGFTVEKLSYGTLLQSQTFVIASPNSIAAVVLRFSGASRRYCRIHRQLAEP
jgi:hypothetical protein